MQEQTQDKPCQYHQAIVDGAVKNMSHSKELRDEMAIQSRVLLRVESAVAAINTALIGTLDKQGLIGRVDKQISDLQKDLKEVQQRQDEIETLKNSIIWTVVKIGIGALALVVGAAWAIVKSTIQ